MDAVNSVNINRTTWCNIPEDSHLHACRSENLKSHITYTKLYFFIFRQTVVRSRIATTGLRNILVPLYLTFGVMYNINAHVNCTVQYGLHLSTIVNY
jgi:hypothetical protein